MKRTKKEIIFLTITCVIILVVIHSFLFFEAYDGDQIDADVAAKFGDFIGGYIGTILAFGSVILLYLTFRNEQISSAHEKFENKFFGLIDLHKNNVSEIEFSGTRGKKVFVLMIREFREILEVAKGVLKELKLTLTPEEKMNFTYMVFYYGIGPNSTRILKAALINFDKQLIEQVIKKLEEEKLRRIVKRNRRFNFRPFGGHQSRLGHYYRHLFQTVKFVHNQDLKVDKKSYVKILRAQLSNHEQALLFLNSLSYLGKNWKREKLIITYELIKNIPKSFFNEATEIDVKNIYPEFEFEWEEIEKTHKKTT